MNSAPQIPPVEPQAESCWRRIGVWGDRTCPELAAHSHCGNCPVFAAAGRALFDRAAPDGYLGEWADVLATPADSREETVSALVLRLGPVWLALPSAAVASITELRAPHLVPHRSGKIFTGLVNIAGELQLAFDVRALFGLAAAAPANLALSSRVYPRLVLCRREGRAFAFAADEVYGSAALPLSQMLPVPSSAGAALSIYARGQFSFRKRQLLLLDDELLAAALARLQLS
ncbi:MAG TPA: chemotaxis protein CheW [Opitutales bacterium]|nr:chemotaxis protein CheW [Opitutales bacterium]